MPHGTSLATLVDVHVPRVPIQATMSAAQLTSGISNVVHPSVGIPGLVAWYDASQISGIASGTALSTWTDLSGLGNHLQQPSAASQPIFVKNAQNGLSVVSSTGTLSGIPLSFMTAGFTQAQPTTIVATFSFDSTVAFQQDIVDGVTQGSTIFGTITATRFQAFPGTTTLDSLVALSVGSWYAGGTIFNGSSSTIFIGSTTSVGGSGTGNPAGLSVFARSGATRGANVKIGELFYYGRALTATELSILTTYLKNKWNTAL
jgi:hypothetical protein